MRISSLPVSLGLFAVALSSYFGRLPVLFVFQYIAFATCAWAAAVTDYKSFEAARVLNGFFESAGQCGALMWIKDIYFFHEQPRKIDLVELAIIISPYAGPLIASFIIYKPTWNWVYWVSTIL